MAEVVGKINLSNQMLGFGKADVLEKNFMFSCKLGVNFGSLGAGSGNGSGFTGQRVGQQGLSLKRNCAAAVVAKSQMTIGIPKSVKWWEKGMQPNMKEVTDAQDLVDSLLNAGDKLVVVEFFSPGCGGCKALHPKICQLAEMNPDVQFLQVNYEEHKSMCYSLNVHVLPFFRFYRGAHGRLCSFSCTNATIKKFKDALAKHKPDRCSLEPTKGLEEKELVALAANRDLNFSYVPKTEELQDAPAKEESVPEMTPLAVPAQHPSESPLPLPLPLPLQAAMDSSVQDGKNKTLVSSGR